MVNIVHWLLPKGEKFFDMLNAQASNVIYGVNEFKNLIYNYNLLSDSKKRELINNIEDIEHKGDTLTHEIIRSLDETFITPIDKEDIHHLAMILDDVLDLIYATSLRLIISKITRIDSYMKKQTTIAIEIIKKIEQGLKEVSKLQNMQSFYVDVHTLENKGDDVYHAALARLFDEKDPITIIKYKEIYEFLEDIIDKCEDIANVIESIVVKHA